MVVDTNVFIEYLRAKNKQKTSLYLIQNISNLSISIVTLYELLIGSITPSKWNDVQLITEDLEFLPMTKEISIKSAQIYLQLRKENKIIEPQDIFIAATAIENKLPLITLNKKHFSRIDGLELIEL